VPRRYIPCSGCGTARARDRPGDERAPVHVDPRFDDPLVAVEQNGERAARTEAQHPAQRLANLARRVSE
jgi:hypothetical protein